MRTVGLIWTVFCCAALNAPAQLMISANENKIDLTSGVPKVIPPRGPDSISLLDFKTFPPRVRHLEGVPNTVIGPPSNVAITPDHRIALVANSIKIDPNDPTNTVPEDFVQIIDLESAPLRVIGKVQTDLQPSGLSITRDGRWALVANRASGTISVLSIHGREVERVGSVNVCDPKENVSDVAISPDGKRVLASVQKTGYLAMLEFDNGSLRLTGRKISACGQPYRCVITPDGQIGLTAGLGAGNGLDLDAVSVIDLAGGPRTIDYIPVGTGPESLEVSPNGRLVAVTVMNGSNLPEDHANHSKYGGLVLLGRRGISFRKLAEYRIGPIPEGVAFTADGKYLVVQCHPEKRLWIFRVRGERLEDTGQRLELPGMPSALRAAP